MWEAQQPQAVVSISTNGTTPDSGFGRHGAKGRHGTGGPPPWPALPPFMDFPQPTIIPPGVLAATFWENTVKRIVHHVVLPAIAPGAITVLYYTPVSVVGCVNRGLMALGVALASAALAFVTVGLGLKARWRNDPDSGWWILSTLILALPLVLCVGPLG